MEEVILIYRKVYEILDRFPVSKTDCGEYCGKICCCYAIPGDDESGMELLPGEEEVFPVEAEWLKPRFLSGAAYDYPPQWGKQSGCIQIRCLEPCPRQERPINCRLFPFSIYKEDNKFYLALLRESTGYKCPLVEEPGLINPDFTAAAKEAAILLLKIPRFKELVEWDSAKTDYTNIKVKIELSDLSSSIL